ncbi:transposase [Lentibacillus salinarum]|uniref:Transposase n=1 Tax=Lentibacillus salinarum TaxID=446820 RepID=A0ABW3ZYL2_9BACI
MFIGFVLRLESMEAFDREIQKGRFKRVVSRKKGKPSHDTLRDALCQWDSNHLDQCHDQFIAKFKQNHGPRKGNIDGWRIGAIDGVELFTSTSRSCSDCLVRKNKEGEIEHFHRAVVLQKVGGDPRILYGVEHLKPRDGAEKGEGEITGASRLLETVKRHGRLMDIITADALYAKATFIHQVLDQGMDAVIRMKEERRLIMQDARGLFDHRPADVQWEEKDTDGDRVKVEAWDEEGFGSWRQVNVPIRMVKMVRQTERKIIVGGQKKAEIEIIERWVATTCPKSAVPTETISKIAAARWDIENNGFHDLKTYWHLDHPYVHDPTAIEAWVAILVLAVNMVYSYFYMHLHHFREWQVPLKEIIQEMKEQMRWTMPRMSQLFWKPG